MRDHKAFLSALPPATRTALTETSNRAGLIHLAGHTALIVGGTALYLRAYWLVLGFLRGRTNEKGMRTTLERMKQVVES